MTRESIKAAADASWGFGPTTDVQPIEHIPGVPQVGEVWGDPRNPETWRLIEHVTPNAVSYVTFAKWEMWASEPRQSFDNWFRESKPWNIRGMVEDYVQRGDIRGVNWWQQVSEAKQDERDKERERADKAEAEVWRLQKLNEQLAERIAAASEVIARNAERRK